MSKNREISYKGLESYNTFKPKFLDIDIESLLKDKMETPKVYGGTTNSEYGDYNSFISDISNPENLVILA